VQIEVDAIALSQADDASDLLGVDEVLGPNERHQEKDSTVRLIVTPP
jgi:hypothetical protein